MQYPLLKVKTNKTLDKEVCLNFINQKIKDYDFGRERIVNHHPELETARGKKKQEAKSQIDKYIDLFYKQSKKEIVSSIKLIHRTWRKIENSYFKELEKLFGNLSFLKYKSFTAFVSIFECGVLCDDGKSFQIFYKVAKEEPEGTRRLIAHEVLHFYYYAYLKKKGYKNLARNWDMAEIFNVVILNLPQFRKLIGKEELGYPNHEKQFAKFRKLWYGSENLDKYLKLIKGEYGF